jgi:hypothetical protein
MTWIASTFHDQLNAGTELAVFEEPWDPQVVVLGQLPASVELSIDFLDGLTKKRLGARGDRLRGRNSDL